MAASSDGATFCTLPAASSRWIESMPAGCSLLLAQIKFDEPMGLGGLW